MKSEPKIRRVHLKVDTHDASFCLGIVSSEPDYKLSLELNKALGTSLKNEKNLNLTLSGKNLHFSRFFHRGQSEDLYLLLLSNRSVNESLLPKFKKIDYLFYAHDPENELVEDIITEKIRSIGSVTAVLKINKDTLGAKIMKYLSL
jgi:hypothetical protein